MSNYRSRIVRKPLLAIGLGVLLLSACSRLGSDKPKSSTVGVPVEVGPLVYTVMGSDWREQLVSPNGPRLPAHRFLLVPVTVQNRGDAEQGIPFLALVDSKGNRYQEEPKGEGVDGWLGYIRTAKAGATEQGYVLFDAPPGSYKIVVSSGGDPEKEKTAEIDLPFMLDGAGPPPSK